MKDIEECIGKNNEEGLTGRQILPHFIDATETYSIHR